MNKKWYNRRITDKDLKYCRDFLNTFNVRCRFNKYMGCLDDKNNVAIYTHKDKNTKITLREFWSTIFHEFCHILCAREGVYKIYHLEFRDNKNKRINRAIRRCALRAELYVDKRAEKLMKIFLPDIPFKRAYRTKEDQEYLKEYIAKEHPL